MSELRPTVMVSYVLVKFTEPRGIPGWSRYNPGEVAGFPPPLAASLVAPASGQSCAEYCDEQERPSKTPVTVRVATARGPRRGESPDAQ